MKIAFVRPTLGARKDRPYHSRAMMEPLVFAALAGMTPSDVDMHLYDERIERVPVDEPFDLVAISVETYAARRAYQLAGEFRRRGVPVVLGGFHPTLVPEEAADHADAIAIGEVEGIWPQILADAREGKLQPRYQAIAYPLLTGLHHDRSIFSGKAYLPLGLVQFSRGCTHQCDFCSVRRFYGGHMRHRPVQDVIAEIEGLRTRNVFFVDDNITADRTAARELFASLKSRRIRWLSQAGLDIVNDPALLDLMVESGCFALIIGLESLNPINLVQMNKSWAAGLGGYAAGLRELKRRGILVYGAFVFGYDDDTPESFDATVDFALEHKLCIATFNMLQPFPGTPLYVRLQAEGRLLYDRWWLDPAYRWDKVAFRPARMTPEELEEACARARRRFTSAGSILARALDVDAHLKDPFRALVYFAGNLISRQDIHRKVGLPLGYAEELPRTEILT